MEGPKRRNQLDGIIRLRDYRNLSEFARTNGFSQSWISNVVNGKLYPGQEGMVRLCKALNLSLLELRALL